MTLKKRIANKLRGKICTCNGDKIEELVEQLHDLLTAEALSLEEREFCEERLTPNHKLYSKSPSETLYLEYRKVLHRLAVVQLSMTEARYALLQIHTFIAQHTQLKPPSPTYHLTPNWTQQADDMISALENEIFS